MRAMANPSAVKTARVTRTALEELRINFFGCPILFSLVVSLEKQ